VKKNITKQKNITLISLKKKLHFKALATFDHEGIMWAQNEEAQIDYAETFSSIITAYTV